MYVDFTFEQVKILATYLVQLTKEGAAYKVESLPTGWRVTITGF